MNFQQSKVLLDKINRLFEGMAASPEQINSIEKDLMMNYIRDLYEQFYWDKNKSEATKVTTTPPKVKQSPVISPKVNITPQVPELPKAPKLEVPVTPPKKVEKPTPVAEKIVKPSVVSPPPVKEEKPVVKKEEPKPEEKKEPVKFEFKLPPRKPVKPTPIAPPPMEIDPESAALFESKKATELSEKLSQSPIMDLNKAFGLNDRMLYTNELFGGNNNDYKETMSVLNSLNSLEQAKIYLIENIAGKYAWTAKDKKKIAKDFIKTISRKYV